MLSTRSATALYVGAVLGPGVLILPALAAEAAGPASVLAWAGLLAISVPLAITFAVLGVRHPEAGGTAAYARAAFGSRAAGVTGWWFLAGVVLGAPAVAMIGGFYVAELLGAGREAAVVAAGGMIASVLGANALGMRATARLQLGLAGVLAALLLVAVVSALPESRAANWTPFAPHGWAAVGEAASLLMLSFIGWEAVSHLAGELRDPARQLPRAIFAALAIVAVLYLGLSVATVGVLGTAAPTDVPLADLMAAGLGAPGRTVTAFLAVLLTMGAMNAYVAAAAKLAGALAAEGAAPARSPVGPRAGADRRRRRRPARAARGRRAQRRGPRARVQRRVRLRVRDGHRRGRAAARRRRPRVLRRRARRRHRRARLLGPVPARARGGGRRLPRGSARSGGSGRAPRPPCRGCRRTRRRPRAGRTARARPAGRRARGRYSGSAGSPGPEVLGQELVLGPERVRVHDEPGRVGVATRTSAPQPVCASRGTIRSLSGPMPSA